MDFHKTEHLSSSEKKMVLGLWNNEYPLPLKKTSKQFDDYLNGLESCEHILLKHENKVKGWFFAFVREDEWWFAMIIDRAYQNRGVGSKFLEIGKENHQKLLGWVIDQNDKKKADGSNYRTPLGFYLKNGFEILPKVRLELPHISAVKIELNNVM